MSKRHVVFALTLTAVFAVRGDAKEGFGYSKTAVNMTRTTAPGVNMAGTRFDLESSYDDPRAADDAKTLQRYTEAAIIAGDKRLSVAAMPETHVFLKLGRSDANENWEQETSVEYQKTGTKDEYNKKKDKWETVDVYENVDVTSNVEIVTAIVDGTYNITGASGSSLDSGYFTQKFSQKYDSGIGSKEESGIKDDLLHKAAQVVAARLVPTHDRVQVIIPKGSFEALIPLAESGAWDRYLAAVEAMPENKSPDQEAYRQYAIAVGKEAVAYGTDDIPHATELLQQAVGQYKKAIADNPAEKDFSGAAKSFFSSSVPAPLPRAEETLAAYQKWAQRPAQVAESLASSPTPAGTSAKPKTMRNKTVIQMSKAGLSDATIVTAIDSGVTTKFDVSPTGLDALAKGGVSKPVIAYMQNKMKK